MSNRALGILETRGMAALMAAADAMLKRAQIRLCGRHGIGSGWLTLLIEGETAAVNAAMRAGEPAAKAHGELIFQRVVPSPEGRAMAPMPHTQVLCDEITSSDLAVGVLETKGVTPLMAGADAMVKAADVEIIGWTFSGGALVHVVGRGEVAGVQTAGAAGEEAAGNGGEDHANPIIPQDTEKVLE